MSAEKTGGLHMTAPLGQDDAYVYGELLVHSAADLQMWREDGVL